jgi:hypothetical protein
MKGKGVGSTFRLPREVGERIGPFYVYVLVDPRDAAPFYVGKGTGERLLAHGFAADLEEERGQSAKTARIHEIRDDGSEPVVEVVRHGLTEAEAFLVEAALIDTLPNLTNIVRGHDVERGRTPLMELVSRYGAPPLQAIEPPVLMIRLTPKWKPLKEEIEKGYQRAGAGSYPGMTRTELYDAVRAWWKLSPESVERRQVRHVVAVIAGITRAIYEIGDWIGPRELDGRWGFRGKALSEGELWEAYVGPLGKRVPFTTHSQNPLVYWPLNLGKLGGPENP